jgi:hypothetical protein
MRRLRIAASERSPSERRAAGELLLHPVALCALVVVLVNDHILKPHAPSTLSGKASDFAGLIYFPLLIASVIEVTRRLRRVEEWPTCIRQVVSISAVVGAAFAAIKLLPVAGDVYRAVIGFLMWPIWSFGQVVSGEGPAALSQANLVQDPWDLIALPCVLIPVWIVSRYRTQITEVRRTSDPRSYSK